jgi:hypothetical protein
MSTEELRRWLDYPDEDVQMPDLREISTRAVRQRTRRRMVTSGGTLALGVVAVVAYVSIFAGGSRVFTGIPSSGGDQQPGATSPAPVPTPTPSPIPSAHIAGNTTVQVARSGQHIDLGHGWSVWITAGGDVCRRSPSGNGFGCSSTTDGNIGGLNMQMSASATESFISAVIPYRAAEVDVIVNGTAHPADLIRFRGLKGWTFYSLWLPGSAADATIAAYDEAGQTLKP